MTAGTAGLAGLFDAAAASLRAGYLPDRAAAAPAVAALDTALRAHDPAADVDLAGVLVACADTSGFEADTLTDAVAVAAGLLGDRLDDPDRWDALIALAAHLQPSGCWALEPAPLLTTELVAALAAEAVTDPGRGPVLSALAASPELHQAAAAAAGLAFTPSGYASYQHDQAGVNQPAHLDRGEYPYVLHVVIAHTIPPDATGSELIIHHRDAIEQFRVDIGDGVLLAGRGTLHHWQRLAAGEHRTLIAIGLTPS